METIDLGRVKSTPIVEVRFSARRIHAAINGVLVSEITIVHDAESMESAIEQARTALRLSKDVWEVTSVKKTGETKKAVEDEGPEE